MICPKCNKDNVKVLESRDAEGGLVVRRRRVCEFCEFRFTTFERVESAHFIVVKKDGTREPYDREKILKGVWRACTKRSIPDEKLDKMVSSMEQKWMDGSKEIESQRIGIDIMESLKELDKIAYIRFASVYRDFKDVDSLKSAMNELLK